MPTDMDSVAADSPLELTARMEALAEDGEWAEIAALSVRLRDSVARVQADKRRDILLAVQRSTDTIHTIASRARNDVQGQLSSLRRGRDAAKAYGLTDQMAQLP